MEKLKPNEQRAKNAILWIWIVLALEIISLISSYMQYSLLQTVAGGGFISDKVANANNTRESIVGFIYAIAYIISFITFIMWFRRAYFNLHQKDKTLQFSEGWAAGSWFVPIVNLYRPYQIMKEIYNETKYLLTKKGLSEKVNYSTIYLGWWWALWIISGFIGQIVLRYTFRGADTVERFISTTIGHMILSVLGIPLAFIMVKIIKDYSRVEPLLTQVNDEQLELINEDSAELLPNE
ncbi:MAG: DUF4328 domain-containing protein [Bacteroidales bacterium]|nr:DUF4328 domain-containing protein [Bacteroidales bacterium]